MLHRCERTSCEIIVVMNPLKTTYYNFGDLVAVSPKIQSKRKLLVPENTKIMSMMCDF